MRTISKLVASLMFAAAFFVSGHNASAAARDATGSVALSAGTLSVTVPGTFSFTAKTLDGVNAKDTTRNIVLAVNDGSATNAGWKLQATMGVLTSSLSE